MATAGDMTTIGRTVRIRGRVTGSANADLEIEGYVEGDVTLEGELTIGESGRVGANVRARSVVIRGAIRGDVQADDVIRLEAGARVVGDVRAPRVSIAPGAKVRGFVQTAGAGGAAPRAAATRATAKVSTAASVKSEPRPAAVVAPVAAPVVARAAPAPTTAPVPTIKQAAAPVAHAPAHRSGPPAPVVPVIKKAKGQLTKKRGE